MTYEEVLTKLTDELGGAVFDVDEELAAPKGVELQCQWCGADLHVPHLRVRFERSRLRICAGRAACCERRSAAEAAKSSLEAERRAKVVSAVSFGGVGAPDTDDGTDEDQE